MASIGSQKVLRDAFRGFMRIHVLHHAAKEPIYGLELIAELKRHRYVIGPGTLYPLLHALEGARLLRSSVEVVAGKRRKYYRTTRSGDIPLVKLRAQISELVREIVYEHDELAKWSAARSISGLTAISRREVQHSCGPSGNQRDGSR